MVPGNSLAQETENIPGGDIEKGNSTKETFNKDLSDFMGMLQLIIVRITDFKFQKKLQITLLQCKWRIRIMAQSWRQLTIL